MKKFLLLLLPIISITILLTGCNTPTTIEEALKKVDVEPEKIYSIDNFNNISIAFYKEKKSGHQTVGIFKKEKNGMYFIIQQDLQVNLTSNEKLTANAFLQDKTDKLPEFSFQYGVIKDPQINEVNLHMTGNNTFEDRQAKVIELDDLRVWYTYLDIKKIFNIQQGVSKEGKVIYDNSKY